MPSCSRALRNIASRYMFSCKELPRNRGERLPGLETSETKLPVSPLPLMSSLYPAPCLCPVENTKHTVVSKAVVPVSELTHYSVRCGCHRPSPATPQGEVPEHLTSSCGQTEKQTKTSPKEATTWRERGWVLLCANRAALELCYSLAAGKQAQATDCVMSLL